MPIMKDMLSKENYERWDKGLPIRKKPEPRFDDPEQPTVKKQIYANDISTKELESITGQKKNVHNKDGVTFIGYDISIQVKEGKPIRGWITDGDLIRLKKKLMGRKDVEIQVAE